MVLAVDSEPDTSDGQARPFLKDRLFIGYQEEAAVLEVISYNEQAGRFEFQVVKDYREGQAQQVRYAKRSVCASCHQNQGPIFSVEGWNETDNNTRILERLRRASVSSYRKWRVTPDCDLGHYPVSSGHFDDQ